MIGIDRNYKDLKGGQMVSSLSFLDRPQNIGRIDTDFNSMVEF